DEEAEVMRLAPRRCRQPSARDERCDKHHHEDEGLHAKPPLAASAALPLQPAARPLALAEFPLGTSRDRRVNKIPGFSPPESVIFVLRSVAKRHEFARKPLENMRFSKGRKGAAGPWGRAGRANPVWGRGGGGTGPGSQTPKSILSRSGRSCRRRRAARFAKRDPHIRVGLRLAFDKAVAGVRPKQDLVGLVVENEFAAVGFDRENGMAIAALVAHDRYQQRLA